MSENNDDALVEMLFRNGTLTVVGILLSFSLGFVTQWAHNPVPWVLSDIPTLLLLVAGIGAQGGALFIFLRHDSLRRRIYDRAATWFMWGVSLTAAGVVSAIVVDAIEMAVA